MKTLIYFLDFKQIRKLTYGKKQMQLSTKVDVIFFYRKLRFILNTPEH